MGIYLWNTRLEVWLYRVPVPVDCKHNNLKVIIFKTSYTSIFRNPLRYPPSSPLPRGEYSGPLSGTNTTLGLPRKPISYFPGCAVARLLGIKWCPNPIWGPFWELLFCLANGQCADCVPAVDPGCKPEIWLQTPLTGVCLTVLGQEHCLCP